MGFTVPTVIKHKDQKATIFGHVTGHNSLEKRQFNELYRKPGREEGKLTWLNTNEQN